MLKLFNQGRGTGKTTKVLGLLESDANAVLIIPRNHMAMRYKDMKIKNRILTFEDIIRGNFNSKGISKAVIDEGFLGGKTELAKLYYMLGSAGIEVISYGTVE